MTDQSDHLEPCGSLDEGVLSTYDRAAKDAIFHGHVLHAKQAGEVLPGHRLGEVKLDSMQRTFLQGGQTSQS